MLDEYKSNSYLCREAGCTNEDIENCDPHSDDRICFPKRELLRRCNVTEDQLEYQEVTVRDIKRMIRGDY